GAAPDFDHVVGTELGQVQVFDLVRLVDPVQVERLRRLQVHLLVQAKALHLAPQGDVQHLQPRRYAELVDGFAVLEQFEIRNLCGRGDTVQVDGGNAQLDLFQELDRDGVPVDRQAGADEDGGDALRQPCLAVRVNAGGQ